jgi:hypothetical protein
VHSHCEKAAFDIAALGPTVRGIETVSAVRGMKFVCVKLDWLEVLGRVGCSGGGG